MPERASAARQRIGVFAGAFDPVHNGHVAFAAKSLSVCTLDKVYFLVEPRPRHKQAVKSVHHRQAMVQLAIADNPSFGSIHLPDSQFSVHETLPRLQARLTGAKLFMLVGEDVVTHLTSWPHLDELIASVEFIVGARQEHRKKLEERLRLLHQVRGGRLHYQVIEMPPTAHLSSTRIKEELRQGVAPNDLKPEVMEYIARHHLYL